MPSPECCFPISLFLLRGWGHSEENMHFVPATKSLNLRGKLGTSFNVKDFLHYLDSTINRNDASFFHGSFSITTPMPWGYKCLQRNSIFHSRENTVEFLLQSIILCILVTAWRIVRKTYMVSKMGLELPYRKN